MKHETLVARRVSMRSLRLLLAIFKSALPPQKTPPHPQSLTSHPIPEPYEVSEAKSVFLALLR
jgi:hypothetical protein